MSLLNYLKRDPKQPIFVNSMATEAGLRKYAQAGDCDLIVVREDQVDPVVPASGGEIVVPAPGGEIVGTEIKIGGSEVPVQPTDGVEEGVTMEQIVGDESYQSPDPKHAGDAEVFDVSSMLFSPHEGEIDGGHLETGVTDFIVRAVERGVLVVWRVKMTP